MNTIVNSIVDGADDAEKNDNVLTPLSSVHINWTKDHESILIEWADKAMCYRWLHAKAHSKYAYLNAMYTIPVIIISTLTGTANFAQERVPIAYQGYFSMLVGGFNLLAGIITTIQQFLKITQLNEAHRVSSIAWDKFYRNVKIEVAKHPNERLPVIQMIKMCKDEFDRLMETSPNIPDDMILSFKSAFKESNEYLKIAKPEICDVLVSTETYKNQWLSDENKDNAFQESVRIQIIKDSRQKKMTELNIKMITEFKKIFKDLHNREPMNSEIIDNLKDKMELSILNKLIYDMNIEGSIQLV